MKPNKLLSLGLVLALLIPGVLPVSAEQAPPLLIAPPPAAEAAAEPYTDIADHWAAPFIRRAAELGLFPGGDAFGPDETMSRAEFIALLWRASGSPAAAAPAVFTDLGDTPHRAAIDWAWETGMVIGVGSDLLEPDRAVTREEAAVVLHRMAGCPQGMETMFTAIYDEAFTDDGKISSWAKPALYWTVFQEIFCGRQSADVEAQLAPADPASRAQIAVMVVRGLAL